MHREEKSIVVDLDPSVATFIKQGFNHLVRWPLLNIGVVLGNTSTAVNEEWLTAVVNIPTVKIFYKYTHKILSKEVCFFIYFKKSQSESKNYITLYDLDYYIIDKDVIILMDKPIELEETLLHVFQDYRLKSSQYIELIAFSSGTLINDDIISKLTFLDIETFNKEYNNIKPIIDSKFISRTPFIVIAPNGKLTFFVESYSWFDFKIFFKDIIDFLHKSMVSDIQEHMIKIDKCDDTNVSSYNPESGILFVNDLITMNIVNFFGCNARLESYHRFDITKVDIEIFIKVLTDALKNVLSASNII
ncbi:DNA-dependent RNA polymerase rpo35 [Yokapox virus]|uniref:DNA-directed RNA polymerase 35 kDa subunit n=1 Tax=Yokapox virus TaxID=1076255 RepID=G3EI25_9POXV|nr:DNA-dependent RNA polymerase rpo35 [Yokapox virus]AEN03722.1 DNA-dependent RNA polymerase rpo35 [Yokapox virus]